MCSNCKHVRLSWGKYLTDPLRGNEKNMTKKRKREDLIDRKETPIVRKPTYERKSMLRC
jgi:hypothetical protein